jgi:hypothetical protein
MPSDRNLPPADQDDDIVEKRPSHPVTTTLLIVSTFALITAIVLASKELGRYVNPHTKSITSNFKKKAVVLFEEEYGGDKAAGGGARGAAPAGGDAGEGN